ncbi:restriction endonuclease [Streptomyces sp. G-G2]|uniref:restriction endonuclease n=1 Tax=Streptomyces sp. G-G2 TaxID=3046201 RepID=UPI0024B9A279|nr:restriction endonuclease [Streptomyces sp. G-G2]MDJ0382465.1 restriction endonuclease [Streptomyces sp. G-G2]
MSRRSSGLVGIWAEAQRQQQRSQALQQRERERSQRAHEREAARGLREQKAAYRQYREAEARRLTERLEQQAADLQGLLGRGCAAPVFRAAGLRRAEEIEAFDPGPLGHPVPMPEPHQFPVQSGGWGIGAGRRAQAEADAHARYTQAWHAANAAEAERQRQLAAYRAQYDRWAGERLGEIRAHNTGIADLGASLGSGDPEAVVEYFSAALYASSAWPEELPRALSAAYDPGARQLVLDWELPGFEVVPTAKSVRYMPSVDQDKESPLPVGQRRAVYRDLLAQCALLVLRDLFAADEFGALESVALNGYVDDHDPATGRPARIVLATAMADRTAFEALHLAQVNAVDCLTGALRGQLSARPDLLTAVRAARTPEDVGSDVVTHGTTSDTGPDEPDLFAMDPIEFEGLVAELFRAMGMRAVMTQRSNDGGVDVDATDPAPIRGGTIVVQVKRYRNTVPPTAVRDLYGTVQDAGANKGVLVTTSGFGPGSHNFARGKPLELVSGPELVDLLHRHGLRGRLGDGARPGAATAPAPPAAAVPAQRAASPVPAAGPAAEHNILGMTWSGGVTLDVCALVCAGTRVLDDEHFVFFNNPGTPDGSVRSRAHTPPDRAAIEVDFDALPARADRLVLVAAVDPEAHPHADLTGFTDARIRLLAADGAEIDQLEVSDGRPGETALVLGSFRRRASGDWTFVAGGKGYPGGLAALVHDFGIATT